ncbi:MAG: hypothetical protein DRH12_17510 [Deltaproteobacteria bacterium]|nr:MAG: hypothetical protein DRH12_17510 [Deltaproteobacteria bacterium]
MPLINIVYPHRRSVDSDYCGDYTVVHSIFPIADCDMYVYQDAFAYCGKMPGVEALLMLEPYVVLPGEYDDEIWRHFDYILTFVDRLVEARGKFRKINFPVFSTRDQQTFGEKLSPSSQTPIEEKIVGICMINGNKSSQVDGELYSKRKEIALWFHNHSHIPFDVFGRPPFDLPNYRGIASDKLVTLSRYRFAVCFENIYHPFWSSGYISEKLFHCFMAETVPIYLGCYNVERYIPEDLFIDFRKFESYGELETFLTSISDREYLSYLHRTKDWIAGGGLNNYTINDLYDLLAQLLDPSHTEDLMEPGNWKPGVSPKYLKKKFVYAKRKPVWTWEYLASWKHAAFRQKSI